MKQPYIFFNHPSFVRAGCGIEKHRLSQLVPPEGVDKNLCVFFSSVYYVTEPVLTKGRVVSLQGCSMRTITLFY
jgi:hypothetical protein